MTNDSSPVTLSAWSALMRDDLLYAEVAADVGDRPVADVHIYDELDDHANDRNSILLAVGFDVASHRFDRLLRHATDVGAAAVIVKARGTPVTHLDESFGAAMAVMVLRDTTSWAHFAATARSAIAGAAIDAVSGTRLGDVFAFANVVAGMTGGATSIVDATGAVVSYSTLPGQPIDDLRRETTLALHEPTSPTLDAEYQAVYATDRAVMVESHDDQKARLAIAARAGGELLGSIWVIDPGDTRRAPALDALERLAPLAGLHILHARTAADFAERRNADLIRTLLAGSGHASFAAAQLGLGPAFTRGFAVAAFTIVHPRPGTVDAVREQQRLRKFVAVTCTLQFHSSYDALIDGIVFAILPCTGESPAAGHRRLLVNVGSQTSLSAYRVAAAAGSMVVGVDDVAQSRAEAVATLKLLVRRVEDGAGASSTPLVALYDDCGIELALQQIGDFIADNHLDGLDVLDEIRAHDAAHDTDFAITLRTFLDMNGNVARAATQLHVHGNTVRYRIARLTHDFDLDLDQPATRLWLWLRLSSVY